MLTYPCKLNLDFVENPLKLMPILSEAASWLELNIHDWIEQFMVWTVAILLNSQDL